MAGTSTIWGWEGLVMNFIEQRWAVGETFSREEIFQNEGYFARHYPDNQHIRTKLGQVLRTLVRNGEIEAVDRMTYRRALAVKDA